MKLSDLSLVNKLVVLGSLLLVMGAGPALTQDGCANVGCNNTSVTAVLFPDTQATIYVNLRTICGSAALNSCQVNFLSPPTLDPQLKCQELVEAISQGNCLAAGYEVSVNACGASPPFFVVTDPNAPDSIVEVGITCDPNVFSQTGQGQPICDYEGDIITPGNKATGEQCFSEEPTATDITVRGTGTGVPIVTSIPSAPHFSIILESPNGLLDLQLPSAGLSGEEIVALAFEQLRGLGIPVEVINDGRTLRFTQNPFFGPPISCGAATNDTGLTHAAIVGQASMLPTEFPAPFGSLGECISTFIHERCSGLRGKARAACNHAQQRECRLLFE